MGLLRRIRTGQLGVDRALEPIFDAVDELQRDGSAVIAGVVMSSGGTVRIPHRLGRRSIGCVPIRVVGATAAGVLVDAGGVDPAKDLNLTAVGYGATITVDLLVF